MANDSVKSNWTYNKRISQKSSSRTEQRKSSAL